MRGDSLESRLDHNLNMCVFGKCLPRSGGTQSDVLDHCISRRSEVASQQKGVPGIPRIQLQNCYRKDVQVPHEESLG